MKTKKRLERVEEELIELKESELKVVENLNELDKSINLMHDDTVKIYDSFQQIKQFVPVTNDMRKELDEEKNKNQYIIEYLRIQEIKIDALGRKVDLLLQTMEAGRSICPKGTEGGTGLLSEPFKSPSLQKTKCELPLLIDSKPHNLKVLKEMLFRVDTLEDEYVRVLGADTDNKIYFKILKIYREQLEELIKQVEEDLDVGDIAEKLKRVIETSLVKNFANKLLVSAIDKYLMDCKFGKYEIPLYEKITDEMYAYIGQPLVKKVEFSEKNNVILGKKHDAYFITYKDENDLHKKIITGECEIGKYT